MHKVLLDDVTSNMLELCDSGIDFLSSEMTNEEINDWLGSNRLHESDESLAMFIQKLWINYRKQT